MSKFYVLFPAFLLVVFGVYYTQVAKPEMARKVAAEQQRVADQAAADEANRLRIEAKAQEDARRVQEERTKKDRDRDEKARREKDEQDRKIRDETLKLQADRRSAGPDRRPSRPKGEHESRRVRRGRPGRTGQDRPAQFRTGDPAHVQHRRPEGDGQLDDQNAAAPAAAQVSPQREIPSRPGSVPGLFFPPNLFPTQPAAPHSRSVAPNICAKLANGCGADILEGFYYTQPAGFSIT